MIKNTQIQKKIKHPSGAIEYVDTDGQKALRLAIKNKKKGSDLTNKDKDDLLFQIGKDLGYIK